MASTVVLIIIIRQVLLDVGTQAGGITACARVYFCTRESCLSYAGPELLPSVALERPFTISPSGSGRHLGKTCLAVEVYSVAMCM